MVSEEETSDDEECLGVDYAEDWATRKNYDYVENYEEWCGEENYYQEDRYDQETFKNYNNRHEESGNFCDSCERGFRSEKELKIHLSEHRVCGIDGCTFVAHNKILEKHISMQHLSGLYYRIAKTDNPEDVAKWIAERKKRYPTKENIERRELEQEEMMKRGERIQKPKDRFGRNERKEKREQKKESARLLKEKKKKKVKKLIIPQNTLPIILANEKLHWKGDLPPFEGTSELYGEEEIKKFEEVFDDDEWMNDQNTEVPKIEISNALGALIGAYRSDDDSDEEICVKKEEIQEKEMGISAKEEILGKEVEIFVEKEEILETEEVPIKVQSENIKLEENIYRIEQKHVPEIKIEIQEKKEEIFLKDEEIKEEVESKMIKLQGNIPKIEQEIVPEIKIEILENGEELLRKVKGIESNNIKFEDNISRNENLPEEKKNSTGINEIEKPEEQKILKEDNQMYHQKENKEYVRNRKRKRKNSQSNIARNINVKISANDKKPLKCQTIFPKKITLLEKLLEPEIRHERNFILQCVRYVVENNFFQQNVI